MSSGAERRTRRPLGAALPLVAALLVGVNLRPAITSVAALLDEASAHFGLSAELSGVLVTLPVIAFGLTAPIGPWLARRIGVARALGWAMLVLAVALALRVLAPAMLLPGTFIAGAAIMAAGTLLPQYLKSLNAGGLWVGLSSMSFGVGAALGAGVVVPVHRATGESVPAALGLWSALAVVAAIAIFLVAQRSGGAARSERRPRLTVPERGAGTIALVTAVFGLQALLYFAVTAWMPQFLADRGIGADERGWLLAWFSVAGFLPTLVTPMIARRPAVLRWFGPGLGVAVLLGLAWLFVASSDQYVWVVGLLGAVQSAAFGLAISLIVSLSANPPTAGVMSAVGQGVGYAFAGAGSLLIGIVHAASGDWSPSFALMAALAALLSVAVALVIRRMPVDLLAAQTSERPTAAESLTHPA
ncbi:CP family cyanate transporter-like MFS transporter [Microterricola gilva]|uniref:CP family cyanate transporter-like MFS transporter n=2 Tax=Microterricola gilva TaxID=393267 RepID=A0A4Q8AMM4_9MICO|nr:CP family cyanate transporter-like MFS transporter [Microterricola gilva]